MLKNNFEKLVKKNDPEYWSTSIKVDYEYKEKWEDIQRHYNKLMESAPSKADVFRNAIDIIHGELYGNTNN
jgi:hypothetical protein